MASIRHDSPRQANRWVDDNPDIGRFRVARDAFLSEEVLEREQRRIFERCWLYIGHSSELPNPNDFVTRDVAGRELIFNRDRTGTFRAFFNTCPHRGATVERRKCGNALGFKCFYHGWGFNNNGRFATRYAAGTYPDDFGKSGELDLPAVAQLDQYRDFWFVNFDKEAESLSDFLADAKEILSLVADHSPNGMEIIGGAQEYSIDANWKLLAENSYDSYHAKETHSTYFDYLTDALGLEKFPEPSASRALDLGKGHACIESQGVWGRPVARWVPPFGEEARNEMEVVRAEIVERLGPERGRRITDGDRNMVIFPNLVINDIMAITVRTFYPVAPGKMNVNSWALGVIGEGRAQRKRRLDNFLEFLGPGGFATPDDVEALESVQRGYRNAAFAGWNDISRGALRKSDWPKDDEHQMRTFWREWSRRMESPQ